MPDAIARMDWSAELLREQPILARAVLLAERLDTHRFEQQDALGRGPLVIHVREGGVAALFRYGVVVTFNVKDDGERALIGRLEPLLTNPHKTRETEETRLTVRSGSDDQIELDGAIALKEIDIERLQLIADVLAKSLMLAHYEARIAATFDHIEPVADTLRRRGRLGIGGRPLLQQIGNALRVQHNLVGRVETAEKPDLLWDHPEFERLHTRLAEEYELRDRDRALDHKQDVILRTSEIMLSVVQQRSAMRVEWYVLLLIVAELIITLYSLR